MLRMRQVTISAVKRRTHKWCQQLLLTGFIDHFFDRSPVYFTCKTIFLSKKLSYKKWCVEKNRDDHKLHQLEDDL